MDGATFKRPPPASSRHRVIIKVLPWKVPVGYGDVAPEEVKQWVESVEVSMPLTRFCARIKHTFENDLHHGKGCVVSESSPHLMLLALLLDRGAHKH